MLVDEGAAGVLGTRLAVYAPERRLVVELDGDELARLLAGESVAVPGTVRDAERSSATPPDSHESGYTTCDTSPQPPCCPHRPLAITSKTMRHSTLSTTTEIYGHLLRHAAHQAVEAIDLALTTAENTPPAA